LIAQAHELVKPEDVADLAEVYLYEGHVARAERKPMAARAAFKKAIELNADGLYGLIARRELSEDKL